MRIDDEFDQVLDDALAEYREAEPLAGLEERVLQRLRLQSEQRRSLWWRWSAIAAAAAVLVVAVWIGARDRTRHEVLAPSVVQKQAPIEPQRPPASAPARDDMVAKNIPVATTASRSTHMSAPVQLASSEAAPMPERFPSPAPLKPEERMLLALAMTHPEILPVKSADDREIVVDPINIKPLSSENRDYQGEN